MIKKHWNKVTVNAGQIPGILNLRVYKITSLKLSSFIFSDHKLSRGKIRSGN